MTPRAYIAALAAAALVSGCKASTEGYCTRDEHCLEVGVGLVCERATHRCIPPPDVGADSWVPPPDGGPPDGVPDLMPDGPTTLENGQPCGDQDQCQSGHCVNGVCCNEACQGTCVGCDVAGSEGTCSPVPVGKDPRAQCTGSVTACDGTCNGAGACAYPDAPTPCGTPYCVNSGMVWLYCDGSGGCKQQQGSCGGYACSPAGDACKSYCSINADCATGFHCEGTQCVAN